MTRAGLLLATAGLAIGLLGGSGMAAPAKQAAPPSIWEQETLTGDWGGARTSLKEKSGIELTLTYIAEVMGVASGGINRRGSFEGRFEFSVDTDLEKLVGWNGATTHVTVFQIHNGGRNAADNVGSISDPSNIDALATTRLFTAWFQQSLFDDRLSVRIGQLAADDEFITSPTAGGLMNGTFGWAGILAANLTSGGPAYPLATPGARVQVKPSDNVALLGAVFSGDPAGKNCLMLPQECNRSGTTFSFHGGALWMGEAQYLVNPGKKPAGLPGIYKLGVWYATADYADQRLGVNAVGAPVSLADPASVGPLNRRGNWGVYGVADQTVWQGAASSVNLFMRAGATPDDRNLLSFYVDGRVGIKGPFAGRADDLMTFGFAYARIGASARALDGDTLAFAGPPYPIRDHELVFELSYQAQVAPWWVVQPDIQYIVHPGGNVPHPADPTRTVGDALVFGLRSTIKF